DLDPISDKVVDTTYFYKEILSPEEPEAGPLEDQGEVITESKSEESPAPKKPAVKKSEDEIKREIRIKNSDAIQKPKSASNDNYKASVNYLTKNRTTTINF
ncbi:MAG: hypothetical protein ACKO96_11415, partial [Flammeovirgaceae bacterium]